MKKSLIAVGVVGLMGISSVAMAAAEFDWTGSIRAGYVSADSGKADKKVVKTLGKNTSSRIGINAKTDLGNGQSAGAELSYNVGGDLTTRRQNVWLSGGWGKLTLGQQGGIYRSAANWDQSYFHGGNIRFGGDVNGATGVTYASNLGGPFSFDVEAVSGEGKAVGQWATTAHYNFGPATVNLGYHTNTVAADNELSRWGADGAYKNTAISINGSTGAFSYWIAYESSDANPSTDTQKLTPYDAKTTGVFVNYSVSESDNIYLEYETADIDHISDDPRATMVGYSHSLGDGVTFITEYLTVDQADSDNKPKTLNLSIKYDF